MIVQGHVDGVRVEEVSLDVVDERPRRNTREAADFDSPPAAAAVLGDLDQPVVGPGVENAFDYR